MSHKHISIRACLSCTRINAQLDLLRYLLENKETVYSEGPLEIEGISIETIEEMIKNLEEQK